MHGDDRGKEGIEKTSQWLESEAHLLLAMTPDDDYTLVSSFGMAFEEATATATGSTDIGWA